MHRILDEPAYIIHARLFRDTSLLLDLLTLHHGRVSVLAKGVRRARSRWAGLLQPFVPLNISYSGKSTLKILSQAESLGAPLFFTGAHLYSALYLNELLYKLLPHDDADEAIFDLYQNALQSLTHESTEIVLRLFELRLLKHLGFGLSFQQDATGLALQADVFYEYWHEKGWCVAASHTLSKEVFSGEHLLAIGAENFCPTVLKEAKRIARILIQSLIGKPIMSRALFQREVIS